MEQIVDGDRSALPQIEVLPEISIPGAAGAYAAGTGKIYLNQKWLEKVKEQEYIKVLTEEFGHHLDSL